MGNNKYSNEKFVVKSGEGFSVNSNIIINFKLCYVLIGNDELQSHIFNCCFELRSQMKRTVTKYNDIGLVGNGTTWY